VKTVEDIQRAIEKLPAAELPQILDALRKRRKFRRRHKSSAVISIEQAITVLPETQLSALSAWFRERFQKAPATGVLPLIIAVSAIVSISLLLLIRYWR
jgi:hypothetical protein